MNNVFNPYVCLILAFLSNAMANMMLKLGALQQVSLGTLLRGSISMGHVIIAGALAFFALNFVFYVLALQRIPISIGYPVMIGMTFAITTIGGLLIGERLNSVEAVGLGLILLGVIIALRASAG
jgi:small multidrug resistance pump